jgi:uncharacterized membrane protein HdeD (DUF308 family)
MAEKEPRNVEEIPEEELEFEEHLNNSKIIYLMNCILIVVGVAGILVAVKYVEDKGSIAAVSGIIGAMIQNTTANMSTMLGGMPAVKMKKK